MLRPGLVNAALHEVFSQVFIINEGRPGGRPGGPPGGPPNWHPAGNQPGTK